MTIGERIKFVRKKHGLTQVQLLTIVNKVDKRFTSYGDKAQEIATNGAVGLVDNTEVVNYIIIYKTALLLPLKLSEYLQHENPPGLSGWLCEGRIYFDAFLLKNKKDGIFVSVNSSYVADEAVTGE